MDNKALSAAIDREAAAKKALDKMVDQVEGALDRETTLMALSALARAGQTLEQAARAIDAAADEWKAAAGDYAALAAAAYCETRDPAFYGYENWSAELFEDDQLRVARGTARRIRKIGATL